MNREKLIIPGLLILFVAFAQLQSIYGWSTLSISQVTYSSNDPKLSGPAYTMTIALTGQGQSAYGETNKALLDADPSDLSESGTTPNEAFTLESTLDYQNCVYDIIPSSQTSTEFAYKVGSPRVKDINELNLLDRDKEKNDFIRFCDLENGLLYEKPGWVFVCFPLYEVGLLGNLDSPDKTFQSTLTLKLDNGKTSSVKIGFPGTTSANIGDFAHASWVGNFETGLSCPSESNFRAMYSPQGWETIHEGKHRAYKNYIDGTIASWEGISFKGWDDCINRWKQNVATERSCAEEWNAFADLLLQEDKISDSYPQLSEGDKLGGKATVQVDDLLFFPVLTLKIKALELGISVPVGKPSVTSLTSLPFKAGETGSIKATIENIGEASGSFEIQTVCTNGFNADLTSFVTLNAGTSIQKTITLNCDTSSSELRGGCTVTARDRNNPALQSSRSVAVACAPHQICTPGENRCDGLNLMICNSAGTGWTVEQYNTDTCETSIEGGLLGSISIPGLGSLGDLQDALESGIWTLQTALMLIILIIVLGVLAYFTVQIVISKLVENVFEKLFG